MGGSHPFVLPLFALSVTLAAVLLCSTVAATVDALRIALAARRRARARADELLLLGAAVQRWRLTPAAWGGAADGFGGVSFGALGLATLPLRPGLRRTDHGVYRLVHVPACAALDRAAVRTGLDAGGDGVLVVGWDPVSGEASAAVVLSGLVQVPLARVPWAWIAELTASAPPAPPASVRARTRSRGADCAPDRRPCRPVLRLVHWPDRPRSPHGGAEAGRAPPGRGAVWRRAA